jgi:Histidine kinase-, DNA gyrase B-, and HSP90-like ATPase
VGSGTERYDVTPSAARLTESLRDIGYDFPAAVADIVDNSVAAGARRVQIDIEFDGTYSRVFIADDGRGMGPAALTEALRFGTRREYGRGDLGRYGLGLKTASLSQCRCVTVVSRTQSSAGRKAARMLDLDLVHEWDDWLIVDPGPSDRDAVQARSYLLDGPGTVVLWRDLDRVLPENRPDGGWARRRLETLAQRTAEHLSMVFHRFLEGSAGDGLSIAVNGEKLSPWNPFAPDEPARLELSPQEFEVVTNSGVGLVRLSRFVLPSRNRFRDPDGFDRLSGPLKWNRQQGLYIYRAGRLVQWGGWAGIRAIDEHTKLARVALEFDTDLDTMFNINVAKMRVSVPVQLRQMIEQPINELCMRADAAYRRSAQAVGVSAKQGRPASSAGKESERPQPAATSALFEVGLAMRSAAMHAGEYAAFGRIVEALRQHAPDVAAALGVDR